MGAVARFWKEECGAITVDWIVLSAAVIGLGMLVLGPIAFSTESSSGQVSQNIRNVGVGYATP
jgi:hypothetical protein